MATTKTAIPPSVTAIRAAATWGRRHPRRAALAVLGAGALLSVGFGIYGIGTGETAALQRCGGHRRAAVLPGLGLRVYGVSTNSLSPYRGGTARRVTADQARRCS
jgi:hypothetical protein